MTPLTQLHDWTDRHHLAFTLITDPVMINYFTGFRFVPEERFTALVVQPNHEPFLFVPALAVELVQATAWPHPVHGYVDGEEPVLVLAPHLPAAPERWAIEPHHLVAARLLALQGLFPHAKTPQSVDTFEAQLRLIKSQGELALMHQAAKDAETAVQVGLEALQAGITEQAIAATITYQMAKRGVPMAECYVQAGDNSAHPFREAGSGRVTPHELVVIDLGTMHQGYMSDITRTVAFASVSPTVQALHQVVQEAQAQAIAAIRPGVTAHSIDAVARGVITKAGYGAAFLHRTGHGIGLSGHEAPNIAQGDDTILQPGMCFSIEPGLYLPGVAGIRIEDCVVVTEDGATPLTTMTRALEVC